MTEKTKQQALKALDGMRNIVKAEMLIKGVYRDDEITNPKRMKSLCGGRKHCAIGSLWVGYGVKPIQSVFGGHTLPGVGSVERKEFLQHRPGLKLAYMALNEVAKQFADDHDIHLRQTILDGEMENLFEGYYGNILSKSDLLKIISSAKRRVKAA